jgi:uncharacterized membrane protein
MKTTLTVIGFFLLAMGLLWMGQGAGYIKWPAESFMISQTQWIYYGGGTALVGLIIAIVGARRGSTDRSH